jgi:hypothetical protein
MVLISALSIIGLIMVVFPRRLVELMDRVEDKIFNRHPVKPMDPIVKQTSVLFSIIVLSTRVVGIFTVALGLFYIVMFIFVYPI